SDITAPAKTTPTRLRATGVGTENSRCMAIAHASTPTENSAMRLVQRAKNDGSSGAGGLMRRLPRSDRPLLMSRLACSFGAFRLGALPLHFPARARRIAQNQSKVSALEKGPVRGCRAPVQGP